MEAPPDFPETFLGALNRSLPVGFHGTEMEHQSFYFFRHETAPQLSGFFGDDFWERSLLQAALCESSIRHAILALGSLHATFQQGNDLIMQDHTDGWTDEFSLKNYGQAINKLVQPFSQKGQQAIDVCLICCVLFACIETMQSRYGSAITHVQSGMKILDEVKYDELTRHHQHDVLSAPEIPYVSIKTLEDMFVRLDFQVTQMISGQKREIPTMFLTLSMVRELLVSRWHVASYPTSNIWDPTIETLAAVPQPGAWHEKSTSIMARWSSAYDVYMNIRGGNLTNAKKKGTAALRILKELGSTARILTQTMVDDETDWDIFCPMFQNVVSLAEDIVELDLKSTAERSVFCIDMALVGSLFKVFCRCRDPIVRRKIISILQKCGRIEGAWNAFSTAEVARRILNIEEAWLQNVRSCEDIPGWARISDVTPVFDHLEQRVILTYTRPRSEHDLTRQTMKEVIEW